jgi:broad specificity phosphatase PhoE
MANQIIICRHAESVEDVDKNVYDVLSDLEIPLTEKGIRQAQDFGAMLGQLLKSSNRVNFYTSPGVRNMQTLKIVLPRLPDTLNVHVEI